jgi:hypothetical protein
MLVTRKDISVRHLVLITLVLGLAGHVIVGSETEKNYTVSGVGGFPISKSISSMWLAGPDRRPLLMAYFHGPEGWHDTEWKIDSKFEKGKPGWAEFRSAKGTLRLWLDAETGRAEVQSSEFDISKSNTFLVLHMGEPSVPQRIIPLGVFDLPRSKDDPASVLLLRANPDLADRIKKEVSTDSSHNR